MSSVFAPTSSEAERRLHARYHSLMASGQYVASTTTLPSLWLLLILAFLMIDSRCWRHRSFFRFAAWLVSSSFSVYNILYVRAKNPAVAYCIGLVSAWLCIWTGVLFVVTDPQNEFQRITRRDALNAVPGQADSNVTDVGKKTSPGNGVPLKSPGRCQRPTKQDVRPGTPGPRSSVEWQGYPDTFSWRRLDWVVDLFFNFRGVGWSWRIDGLPPLPETSRTELGMPSASKFAKRAKFRNADERARIGDPRTHLRYTIWSVFRDYLVLDAIKTFGMRDPWFWGGQSDGSMLSLPTAARLLYCLFALRTALEFTFTVGPLFFLGILGPAIGVRGEAWMYPDTFGSFDAVLDRGLAGWWSGWWHQMFRYGFDAPGRRLNRALGWEHGDFRARFVQLCVAFSLSGFVHACGSATQLGPTHPMRVFAFFALQVPGIAGQLAAVSGIGRLGIARRSPRGTKRLANLIFVHVWLYFTAPMAGNDIAAGGLWLYEPLPLSPLRALGFGPKDKDKDGRGLLQWSTDALWWHTGDHWWNTGVAV